MSIANYFNFHLTVDMMLKNLVFTFFAVTILLFSLPSQAQSNITNIIDIKAQTDDSKIYLDYTITQTFKQSSRGIFLSLPKNQNGIWTNYELKEIIRTSQPVVSSRLSIEEEIGEIIEPDFISDNVDIIKEWNQIRFRVGQEDTFLQNGTYIYNIKLEANYNSSYNYNFVVLRDWQDQTDTINLSLNDQIICSNCSPNSTSINLNNGLNTAPFYRVFWNLTWVYWLFLVPIYLIIFLLWYFLARDLVARTAADKAQFEPPEILPWQAQYMISEGQTNIKNVLLSYLLWLNTHKYISLKPVIDKPGELEIKKLKEDFPESFLPDIYNETIVEIVEQGLEKGVLDSKINPGQHGSSTHSNIAKSLSKYYTQGNFYSPWAICFTYLFVFAILIFVFIGIGEDTFLLGKSWTPVLFISLLLSAPGIYFIVKVWGRPTQEGAELKAYCHGYFYYLNKAEKLKLDFSNNPKEGVQYYLKSVSFAAAFGILDQFQKYFAQIIPNNTELEVVNSTFIHYSLVSFYIPPSSSDGGGFSGGGGGFSGGGGSW
jgi:hypothetical protein